MSRDSEGLVSYSYRMEPEMPLDVQQIQKQMAIVAWQPGPNRFIQTPFKVSYNSMTPAHVICLPVASDLV